MIDNRHLSLVSALLAGLALAGCGSSAKEELAANYCPNPLSVGDADRLTRFKPGPGRDPRDIVFEAAIGGASTACAIKRNSMEVDLILRVAVNAGPSATAGVTHVPYFVRILNGSNQVVQGQEFNADFRLSQASPRGSSLEKLTLSLPFNKLSDLGAYRVAVGLMPTEQELEYNRRSAGR
jgi:hypothetical protein